MKILDVKNYSQKQIVAEAKKVLENDLLVVYPTETCYGIAADAQSAKGVDNLIIYKGDRRKKPISVAVSSLFMAKMYADFNPEAEKIFTNFLPGPITVVMKGKHLVDSRLESEEGTLGLRLPDYPLVLAIIDEFGRPITATSANVSHGKTPYSIEDILDNLPRAKKNLIGLVINAGFLPKRKPSTIIDTSRKLPLIVRQGEFKFKKNDTVVINSQSEKETQALGKKLVKINKNQLADFCLVFLLSGELGAGKTRFAQGVGMALGLNKGIKSPTYVYCQEHPFLDKKCYRCFFHLDVWRLENEADLLQLDFKRMLARGNVLVVEWADRFPQFFQKLGENHQAKIIKVNIQNIKNNTRTISYAYSWH